MTKSIPGCRIGTLPVRHQAAPVSPDPFAELALHFLAKETVRISTDSCVETL